jgi:nonribosomal peptide synthetase MxcG
VKPRVHPLTSAARGIWLGQALNPTCRAYWTAEYLELRGPLNRNALRAAVNHAIREAETLHQRIFREGNDLLARVDVPDRIELSETELPESAARALLNAELPPAPDLSCDPLYTLRLLRVGVTHHLLQLRVHHLALDGTGYGLVYQRLLHCYSQFAQGLTPAFEARPLRALITEEADYRRSHAFNLDRAYYAALLRNAKEPSSLQPLRPLGSRPRVRRSHLSAEEFAGGVQKLRSLRLEPAPFLLATLACWLEEHTGERQHVVGLAIAARFSPLALKSPCMAMNIVPVLVDVQRDKTLADVTRSVQEQLRDGRRHQRYRYEDLRADCATRGVARPFGVVLNYMPFGPPSQVDELQITRHPLAAGPVEDLALSIVAEASGWRCDLEGHAEAYDEATLTALEASWRERLEAALAAPEQPIAELFAPRRIASLLVSGGSVEPLDVLTCLERHAQLRPRAPAIEGDGVPSLNYFELLSEVRRCAGAFAQRGVRLGDRVALLLRRLPSTVAAQLAVLWLGATYVPVDPDGPPERILRVLDDARPSLVVAESVDVARLELSRWPCMSPGHRGTAVDRSVVADTTPAYVIFTSGSTGTPNGVVVSRGALAHFTAAGCQRYGLRARDRILQFSPLQFDASVEEIHLTLASGATLVLRTDEMLESLTRFASNCERLGITVLDLPTAFWHELVDAPRSLPRLSAVRLWIIGGEAAHPEKVQRHFERFGDRTRLVNSYGPTETTVVCATAELRPQGCAGPTPIGGPLPGVELLVLDDALQVVDQGRVGQLAVLGPTLATGYFGREELTSTRFVTLLRAGQVHRAYLTGDRVRVNERSELVYLGRLDDELKLSGHRVQPLEVELALSQLPGLAECAVVGVQNAGRAQLAAYYVPRGSGPAPASLREALRARIHPAAIPGHFIRLERLPRDTNGKVDRNALRKLVPSCTAEACLLSEWERTVAAAFSAVLGHAVASPDADFFALGGHSLAALQLASRLSQSTGFDVPISSVFEHTTVRGMARVLATQPQLSGTVSDPLAPYVILREGQEATVFCVHPADGLAYCYWGLGAHWPGVRLIGLQPWALRHPEVTTASMALERHARLIEELRPTGPLHLLGYSSGGGLALELAALLKARGRDVRTLAMLDSLPSDVWQGTPLPTLRDALVSMLDDLDASPRDASGQLVSIESLYERLSAPGSTLAVFDTATLELMARVALDGMIAYRGILHSKWEGELIYFAASPPGGEHTKWRAWLPYLTSTPQVIKVPASHLGMTQPQILERVAAALRPRLQHRV